MEGESIEFLSAPGKESEIEYISNNHALMSYYKDEDGDYTIQEIESDKPGEAKKIVKAFVKRVGPGKTVRGIAIIEPESRKRLSELGILDHVEKINKAITITSPGVFKSLKITRMLMGGGLKINNIVVSPIPEHFAVDMTEDYLNPRVNVEICCHS